jgi:hypothetical protein
LNSRTIGRAKGASVFLIKLLGQYFLGPIDASRQVINQLIAEHGRISPWLVASVPGEVKSLAFE